VENLNLTREEKLLVLAAIEVNDEETTFSGHNTAWAETVDLVLDGRKGLFDYADDELDEQIKDFDPIFVDNGLESKEALIAWARRLSRIDKIDPSKRTWTVVSAEEQKLWDAEDKTAESRNAI
jgi:hypothetical protein